MVQSIKALLMNIKESSMNPMKNYLMKLFQRYVNALIVPLKRLSYLLNLILR